MKVILKETIDTLGIVGSEVKVADGYARNYLLPRNKAVPATPAFRKIIEQEKKKFTLQIAKERKIAEETAERIKGAECVIQAKVNQGEELYGSVTATDILNAFAAKGIEIEKRMLLLQKPIKHLGEYNIPVRVYADIEPEIKVIVKSE
ncbi:MAG: 50S ribosomal protein L9 [Deltaproteobacteria bacterium]|nr:50S ribosomal protein L9 [Deltaproteobacteria bacterium]